MSGNLHDQIHEDQLMSNTSANHHAMKTVNVVGASLMSSRTLVWCVMSAVAATVVDVVVVVVTVELTDCVV